MAKFFRRVADFLKPQRSAFPSAEPRPAPPVESLPQALMVPSAPPLVTLREPPVPREPTVPAEPVVAREPAVPSVC
jgi:hypothetical protein